MQADFLAPAFNSADPRGRRLALCRTGADWHKLGEEAYLCILWPSVYCETLETSVFDVLVGGTNRVKAGVEKYIALYLRAHTRMQLHTCTRVKPQFADTWEGVSEVRSPRDRISHKEQCVLCNLPEEERIWWPSDLFGQFLEVPS